MSRRYHHFIKNQPQVQVVAQTHDMTLDKVLFMTLAAAFAGVFYFFGYYFWNDTWHVLTGG